MNIRRFLCLAGAFACLAFVATAAWALDVSEWSYAAIAYAPSTGNYRYSYNYDSRYAAEQAALRGMTEKDAKIVCWVNRGFCALALGDDVGCYGTGWEYGDDASNIDAMETALRNCREHTKGARVVLCLVSDGQYIYHPKPVVRPTPVVETPKPSFSFTPPSSDLFAPLNPNFDPLKPVSPFNSRFDNSAPPTNPLLPRNPFAPQPSSLEQLLNPSLPRFIPDNSPFQPTLPQLNPEPSVFPK